MNEHWFVIKYLRRRLCLTVSKKILLQGINELPTGAITISTSLPAPIKPQNEIITESGLFELKGFPNPSYNDFTIQVNSSDVVNKIQLKILDISGRLIQKLENIKPGQSIKLGFNYRPGVYIFEMIQADKRKQLKLIKQPN